MKPLAIRLAKALTILALAANCIAIGLWLGDVSYRSDGRDWCIHTKHAKVCSDDISDTTLTRE